MPQSFAKIVGHLIFSTKDRRQYLDAEIRGQVHAYLAAAVREQNSGFVVVGGIADHVHILCDLPKSIAPAVFVEEVKRESSKFIKTLGKPYEGFFWQRGYALFSVSPTHLESVESYVRRQEEHHQRKTFQDELREILERSGVEFDERYLWG